jgi:hypothetical protein
MKGSAKMKWAVIALIVALSFSTGAAGVGVYFKIKSDKANEQSKEERLNESEARQKQFCSIFISLRKERVKRLANTVIYLHTDAGRELTSLNLYIRQVSLPQTRQEVKKEGEHLPTSCYKIDKEK